MGNFSDRIREPSSWAGIGLVVTGAAQIAGSVFNTPIAEQVAAPVAESVTTYASGGDWKTALVALFTGLLSIFLREKK